MQEDGLDLTAFLDRLASNTPAPGGGAASALVGALGAASVAKVAAVSVGKPKFAAHEAELRDRLDHLLAVRQRFLALAAEDEAAFATYMTALRVPLRIMAAAREVLDAAEVIAVIGNPTALGDCGAGATMALAAMRTSLLNVTANISGLVDGAEVAGYRAQLHDLMGDVDERERVLLEAVRRRLAGEE
jgi:formiminotetrahydrofolate cyclodeaminase